eukprot:TRINITY_DN115494_c0_g1_i1.p1 TRINITY_DN115494_c0_g1~~TRINITY_DN115494_c0_g1_i1.p1  ORF type:complete len:551 (+),score=29.58 TRINITY_DN115494_c0_g1_i1:76-1728(+)
MMVRLAMLCCAVVLAGGAVADALGTDEDETCLLQASARMVRQDPAGASGSQQEPAGARDQHEGQSVTHKQGNVSQASSTQLERSTQSHLAVLRQEGDQEEQGGGGGAQQWLSADSHSDVHSQFAAFIAVLVVYAAIAIAYEIQCSDEAESTKARVIEWDAVKLFIIVPIVVLHGISMRQTTAMHKLWQREANTLQDPLYTEWVAVQFSQTYMMPCFTFTSGVFGQKVDKLTLLRVACYTLGTSVMIHLLRHGIQTVSLGHVPADKPTLLWYLTCLFYWRITLSPLFDRLRDSPASLRAAVFFLVTFILYICYDLFGADNFWDYRLLVPTNEFWRLGPFFALGLLAPSRTATNLLTNSGLQVVGAFVTVAMYCAAVCSPTYKSFLQTHEFTTGWFHMPDASRAFYPSRMGEHLLWFIYRLSAVFSVMLCIAGLTRVLSMLAPGLVRRCLSGGSRTLYAYTLHMCLVKIAVVCGSREAFADMGSLEWCVALFALAIFFVLLLSCQLTERLMHHIVMPLWLMDVLAFIGLTAESRPAAEKHNQDSFKSTVGGR